MATRGPARKLRPRDAPGSGAARAYLGEPSPPREPAPAVGPSVAAPEPQDVAAAVARFLDVIVPPGERGDAALGGTPGRVAQAWIEDLLDGYRRDPRHILAEAMPAAGRDLVAVTGIDFHSMCPHHLLPSRGVAHVAYVPGERVVGFGQIARLVDCFAHRLVLQETLARQVAEALVAHLGARGAGCVLDTEQACLSMRGERRRAARTHVQCFVGALEADRNVQRRFLALIARGLRQGEMERALPSTGRRRRPERKIAARERPSPARGPGRRR